MTYSNAANYRPVNHDLLLGGPNNTITSLAPGTAGNVVTSTGSDFVSSAPTAAFNPNSVVTIFDDFFFTTAAVNGYLLSQQAWNLSGANTWLQSTNTATAAHPGVVGHSAFTSTSRSMTLGTSLTSAFVLGGGAITLNWVFNIGTTSNSTNRYVLNVGIGDTVATSAIANGCWFQYSDNINSGNWTFNTSAASSPTNSNSSTAVTSGWHNAQITINAAGTLVTYVMDGVTLGTIALTIPTLGITPFLSVVFGAGTIAIGTIQVDLFYLKQILTTAR